MKPQTFSQVNNIACTMYHKILLNIAVGYCRIEYTASKTMLKPIYLMALLVIPVLALFTTTKCLMQYSNNRIFFCCNDRNALFQYCPTLACCTICCLLPHAVQLLFDAARHTVAI